MKFEVKYFIALKEMQIQANWKYSGIHDIHIFFFSCKTESETFQLGILKCFALTFMKIKFFKQDERHAPSLKLPQMLG